MKILPNLITIGRMILSLLLIYVMNHTTAFIVIYALCGISDVLDGMIARRTNTESTLGAKLDSAADMLMFGVITASLIVWAGDGLKHCLVYLMIAIFIRCANVLIAACKYHSFIMIHTWGNKITGLLVFFAPVIMIAAQNKAIVLILICIVSIVTALEETLIHCTSDKPDLNRPSIFL